MLFCLVYLRWVFIKGVFAVGSEVVAVCDILIFKNIAFFRNCLLCLFWASFWLRDFGLFFLIVWFDWLFRLVVFYWTVVILCERRKIKVWRCIATLLLLNPVSKRVRADSNGWSFNLGVYCLLWKRFLVLNVVLRAAQVKSFAK